jgi:hypothetical protein
MRIARIFEEPTGKYHVCDDDSIRDVLEGDYKAG